MRPPLAEDFIARGDLVRPIEAALVRPRLLPALPRGSRLSAAAAKPRDWVVAEAR